MTLEPNASAREHVESDSAALKYSSLLAGDKLHVRNMLKHLIRYHEAKGFIWKRNSPVLHSMNTYVHQSGRHASGPIPAAVEHIAPIGIQAARKKKGHKLARAATVIENPRITVPEAENR